MRSNCEQCGESYLDEHIQQVGSRYLCSRCFQLQKTKIHLENSTNRGYSQDKLNQCFSFEFLQKLDSHMESEFGIIYVWSELNKQGVVTQMSFKHARHIGETLKVTLDREEFRQRFKQNNEDTSKIQSFYIKRVKSEIRDKLNLLNNG